MRLSNLVFVIALAAGSAFGGVAQAQQQDAMVSVQGAQGMQSFSPAAAPRRIGGAGSFGLPPLSLQCLEWHCQGAECICIRFTTAQ